MDKKLDKMTKISIEALLITKNLLNCSKKKCKKATDKTFNDGVDLGIKLKKLTKMTVKNKKEYESIFKEHFEKQTVITYQKCIYKNCKDIYFEVISAYLNLFEKLSVFPKKLIELEELKKILRKKTKTYNDLIKTQKNFLILNTFYLNYKKI